jgi:hypothetical protein
MKALILIFLGMMGTATNSLAAGCEAAATKAGSLATLQSDDYFHCTARGPATFEQQKGDYLVQFACVGDTGSGVLSYSVRFADEASCSNPTVVSL